MNSTPGLWDRSRQAAYSEITRTATRLFLQQGFEETTIDQIVAEVGVSRRSFFRYFGTKEDIILGGLIARGESIRAALAERPADEEPFTALRAAFVAMRQPGDTVEFSLDLHRMMAGSPSLRAKSVEKHQAWQKLLVPEIERRMGIVSGDIPDPRASAIVATVLACLDVATDIWGSRGGVGELEDIYDEALAVVRGTA
jgi:AcrR family transcriptional regulator